MPKVTYGGQGGQTFEFETSDDLLAVRTRSGQLMSERDLPPAEAAVMEDMRLEFAFPEAGVEVYRRTKGKSRSALETMKRSLQEFKDTRFAGRVLVQKGSREPVVYTENLFVKFDDSCDDNHCLDILTNIGLTVKSKVGYARNGYFVASPEGTGSHVFDLAQALLDRDDVENAHPEICRQKAQRTINFNQWHLKTTTINGQVIAASANVETALEHVRGEGITIAVIDDGVDINHEEFASSGKIRSPRDMSFPEHDPRHSDPTPGRRDNHGTACAGVACASGAFGASGVAPAARLMPIRSVSALGTMAEAEAFMWATEHGADVISCSWGPMDGRWFDPDDPRHDVFVPMPDSTRMAIEYALANGRGGKGCVIFWAAGNGNESVDNDGYASFPGIFAVAACNDRGKRSVYSDFGEAIFCSFPSGDAEFLAEGHPAPLTSGIWTTDRTGRQGYNPGSRQLGDLEGNYTKSFGGTSSACPGAAGVAALILSRNPELRCDEVGRVMQASCDRIDPQEGDYDRATGRSLKYGFGRLNAAVAVRNAVRDEPIESVIVSGRFSAPVLDFRRTEVKLEVGETRELAGIRVKIEVEHTFIGDLKIQLIPPPATRVNAITLHDREGRNTNNLVRTYDSQSVPALGQLMNKVPKGEWKLQVTDHARRDHGHIRLMQLELHPGIARSVREADAVVAEIGEGNGAEQTTPRRRRRRRTPVS
ncbi:MAG TPA: peptidase S8 [Planctomycetes bacterium]|nr:peptidase S8 [Planctomycetota bacterium]